MINFLMMNEAGADHYFGYAMRYSFNVADMGAALIDTGCSCLEDPNSLGFPDNSMHSLLSSIWIVIFLKSRNKCE